AVRPELLESIQVEERRRKVRLRIQIDGEDTPAKIGVHPRKMKHQRRLPNTCSIVEEGDDWNHARRSGPAPSRTYPQPETPWRHCHFSQVLSVPGEFPGQSAARTPGSS